MPDRQQPGSRWLLLAYCFAAAAGLVGLMAEPSVSVRGALEASSLSWAITVWSVGFVVIGASCALARWRGWYCAEVWAVYGLSGLFWLWAAMVAVVGTGTSWQAGLGFCCTAAFLSGWAGYRRYRLRRNARSAAELRQAVVSVTGEAIRQGGVRGDAEPDQ